MALGDNAPLQRLRPRVVPLLAFLLLKGGAAVSRESAATSIWPEHTGADARSALRRHLQYLDDAFGTLGAVKTPLVRDGSSLALDLAAFPWVDVFRFEAASRDEERLAEAFELYRGDLLENYDADWIVEARERYRAQHLANLERSVANARNRGDLREALRWVAEMRRLEPFREDLVRLSMRLHHARGDRGSALAEFERYRLLLGREVRSEPMGETVLVAEALRSGESPEREPAGLELTSFVGRAAELETAAAQTARHRLVTLTGPPGIGKSRLGRRVGPRLAAALGAKFIELDAAAIPPAPTAAEDGAKVLLLDGCETALTESARFCAAVLESSPEVHVLATSRAPLGIAGERLMRLSPLDDDSSVRLFVDRAEARRGPGSIRRSDLAMVRTICARLEGLPLAIELAAARLSSRTLHDLARADGRDGDAPPVLDETLERAYSSSYMLLDEQERRVLRRLAAFARGFTLETGERASGDLVSKSAFEAVLAKLVDHSLVVPPAPADTYGRYALLAATKAFAVRLARAAGESEHDARQVANAIAERFLPLGRELRGERASAHYGEVEREHPNVLAALGTLLRQERDYDRGSALALAMSRFWVDQGFLREGVGWLREACASVLETSRKLELLRVIGLITRNSGDFAASYAGFVEMVDLQTAAGDVLGTAKAETLAANAARLIGAYDEAIERVLRAKDAFAACGEAYHEAWAGYGHGTILLSAGHLDAAVAALSETIADFQRVEAKADAAGALANLALCHAYASRLDIAESLIAEAVAESREPENRFYLAHALQNQGFILGLRGRHDEALLALSEGLELAIELDDRDLGIGYLETAARSFAGTRPRDAARLVGAADASRAQFHLPHFPLERDVDARLRADLREALGVAFDAHYGRGRVIPLASALTFLRECLEQDDARYKRGAFLPTPKAFIDSGSTPVERPSMR
jgi:predicted ATPase/DNA-binding SARP family transcriptional activator